MLPCDETFLEEKQKIKACLEELFLDKADFAFLFGSWAKQTARVTVDSDVDCGVFSHTQSADELSYFDVAEQFEHLMDRKLDIVCLNTADVIISAQIVATGEEIFAKSKDQLDAWRAQVMSRYFDFKQSRKIIENNILVRPNHGE